MTSNAPEAELFYESALFELSKTFALPYTPRMRSLIQFIFGKAALRATTIGMEFDRVVAEGGHAAGARWFLPRFVQSHDARGIERLPARGPFVIAANHPGSVDALLIAAYVNRRDLKFIIDDIKLFRNMPQTGKQLIVAPSRGNTAGRMQVVRESIRHLQGGGGLLIFPRGDIEADPAFMPNPDGEFGEWSRSLEIFLRRVPGLQMLTAIVSGVIAPSAMKHPITRFRKSRPNRQRLAFVYQIGRQLLRGEQFFNLAPRVTFGELISGGNQENVLTKIEGAARRTLAQHMAWTNR